MEALKEADANLTVYVHPSNASDVPRAVARQLSSLLFSYEERFDGVLLAHEVTVGTEKAKILSGLVPYFGVPVNAKLLLFSPKPDMLLEGKVVMLGKESIHATVLGIFSAAIMLDDIHDKFRFKIKGGEVKFVSRSHKRHVIKSGSMIRFSVKRVDQEEHCHMTGSLIPPNTGSMRWLSKHNAEDGYQNSSKKRPRDSDIEVEQNNRDHRTLDRGDHLVSSNRPHKSRKRSVEES